MSRPDDLAERTDALDGLLRTAGHRLDPALAAEGARVVAHVRERLALAPSTTVVALAGATGSGKSSLFNALAGADVARPGTLRPTTSRPLAAVATDEDVHALLDWLEVGDRHALPADNPTARGLPTGLVLLDLPDHDSVVVEHRATAERLYERADLLVWVLDPQKYADAVLHERYLRPLSGHAAVMVLALNQADRLAPGERVAWRDDVRRLAVQDGLDDVPVVPVSARTGEGVDELRALLARAAERRRAAADRLRADVSRIGSAVAAALDGGADVRRDVPPADRLVTALEHAAGVPTVVDAVRRSAARRVRARTGWPPLRALGRVRPDPLRRLHLQPGARDGDAADRTSLPPAGPQVQAQAANAVRGWLDEATTGLPDAWVLAVRADVRTGGLADDLDVAVASTTLLPARAPWWARTVDVLQWAGVVALVGGLVWLGVLAGTAYLRLPEPTTPEWGPLPAPTALVVGGLALGLLLTLLGTVGAWAEGRRQSARARRRLRASVARVATVRVVDPVTTELARWRSCRDLARRAAGDGTRRRR
ncbi:GTPase [Cellulomonas shaoxiangyii]|uniref:GTP-binding protein HSR1 n=1 Tax=Cellulomonas shaoxiangyii TaxID=2566013 RepID=A0A4P7SN95_9CELL|nr:GTPase [Cellulomonas shaoxiangyii]QCB94073.1 GTP-binding protein HSR1 [Cellulomonas shaoxiangyii]TGY78518.1 GTP-binding protein HSR1 [Cellulomonas shaoxiangyii]